MATMASDAAKHLKSRRAQAELLTDALETGDAAYIANALGAVARARAACPTWRGKPE